MVYRWPRSKTMKSERKVLRNKLNLIYYFFIFSFSFPFFFSVRSPPTLLYRVVLFCDNLSRKRIHVETNEINSWWHLLGTPIYYWLGSWIAKAKKETRPLTRCSISGLPVSRAEDWGWNLVNFIFIFVQLELSSFSFVYLYFNKLSKKVNFY